MQSFQNQIRKTQDSLNTSQILTRVEEELLVAYSALNQIATSEIDLRIQEDKLDRLDNKILGYEEDIKKQERELERLKDTFSRKSSNHRKVHLELSQLKAEIRNEIKEILKEIYKLPRAYRQTKASSLSTLKDDLSTLRDKKYDPSWDLNTCKQTVEHLKAIDQHVKEVFNKFPKDFKKHIEENTKRKRSVSFIRSLLASYQFNRTTRKHKGTQASLIIAEMKIEKLIAKIENNFKRMSEFNQKDSELRTLEFKIAKATNQISTCESAVELGALTSLRYNGLHTKKLFLDKRQKNLNQVYSSIKAIVNELEIEIEFKNNKEKNYKNAVSDLITLANEIAKVEPRLLQVISFKPEISVHLKPFLSTYRKFWSLSLVSNDYQYLSYEDFTSLTNNINETFALEYKDPEQNSIAFLIGRINSEGALYVYQFSAHPLFKNNELDVELFRFFIEDRFGNLPSGQIIVDVSFFDKSSLAFLNKLNAKLDVKISTELKSDFYGDGNDAVRFTLTKNKS